MKQLFFASACLGLILAMPGPSALAKAENPKTFIQAAIQGDNAEIQLGQLAEQKGESKAVRDYGQMLVSDHTKARDEAMDVARSLSVAPPNGAMAKAQREYRRLDRLVGRDFDREFAQYMINDHREDIADFEAQASARDPNVSRMAKNQLPTLHKHLQAAESLMNSQDIGTRG
jgi:putative membrane protein